ncbi:hypothetical protein [Pseudoteredinibacter isoporae]|uniref:hypothetical protein n=1 Tax=Pseudoteredinibacter isoporae TaxID=570281 RepID=UPI00310A4121
MTDQPTKTKQQLLAELESIMSMLDDDAVIPTLDTVVEPEAKPSETLTQTEESAEAIVAEAEPAQEAELTTEPEIATTPESEPQPNDDSDFGAGFDPELRQAMDVEIAIPDVPVPNSQTLFGNRNDSNNDSQNDHNSNDASPNDELDLIDKVSQKFGIDTSALVKERSAELASAPASQPQTDAAASPPQADVSPQQEQDEPGESLDQHASLSNSQQNPFPAPNRKPHLFNGESQAEAPLPGQQHLFDSEPAKPTSRAELASTTVEKAEEERTEISHVEANHLEANHAEMKTPEALSEPAAAVGAAEPVDSSDLNAEARAEPAPSKPENPFKHSGESSSTYPPASLLNSFRRNPLEEETAEPVDTLEDTKEPLQETIAYESSPAFDTEAEPDTEAEIELNSIPETKTAAETAAETETETKVETKDWQTLEPERPQWTAPSLAISNKPSDTQNESPVPELLIKETAVSEPYAPESPQEGLQDELDAPALEPENLTDTAPAATEDPTAQVDPEAIVDDILEAYLPKLEAELRKRLLASLNSDLDF